MPRKSVDITITTPGRDQGKVFHIKEMSAAAAEKWALRLALALGRSGMDIGNVAGRGMAAIAIAGIESIFKLRFEDAEPLFDEMFACVQIKPDPSHPNVIRPLIEDDIDEVSTRVQLRWEALNLHINFSELAGRSTSTAGSTTSESSSPTTSMSPPQSGPSYHPARPRSPK